MESEETVPSMAEDLKAVFAKHMEEIELEVKQTEGLLQGDAIRIMSEEDAERVARKFANLDNEEAAFKAMVKEKQAQFKARRQTLEYLFKYPLKDYVRANLKGKKKSIKLDTVTTGFRSIPESVKTADEDALREWAKVNLPNAFNYDRAPISIETVKDWEADNGPAPGREKVESRDAFYIREAKKKGE